MPEFKLEPVDGGNHIDLPLGETVLGRGPFLGVNDKRVSRHHGILENLNGQLHLKPIHLNPCFSLASVEDSPQPLPKDQWHQLQPGDIFSLLPGKYIYRVVANDDEGTQRNSQNLEVLEDCSTPAASNPQVKTPILASQGSTLRASTEEREKDEQIHTPASTNQIDSETPSSRKSEEKASPQQRRKRELPAWMIGSAPCVQSPSTAKGGGKKAPARPNPAKAKQDGPKRSRAGVRVSDEEASEHSDVEKAPRKRVRRIKSDTEEESQRQVNEPLPSCGTRAFEDEMSDESDGGDAVREKQRKEAEKEMEGERQTKKTAGRTNPKAGRSENGSEATGDSESNERASQNGQRNSRVKQSEGASGSAGVKGQQRTPCPYGSSCYRKNPVHFQECSHPGDDDYEEEQAEDDEDDDRPECPYGTDCYRKNPLHKKEYKHTKPPAKRSVPSEDDEEDGNYDDSFINDDSEEVDEDSDYVPDQSDDSEKEDIKRLQKEAAAFVKRKRK
ncbi:aprataxin and PNK-like factor [Chanos chanos]|uniref:Aprataxin and PNK-like factor n=1 Tax=Chanos chanos TaxID=29144 RepID=A0A6J2VPD6_CHACN|nr:aprataxin and PNK-like factor [Chanos chanos]